MSLPQFKVSLHFLSHDASAHLPEQELHDTGLIESPQLLELLEHFSAITVQPLPETEPHITITASTGKYKICTGRGKLFLYNARDTSEPYVELTAQEILQQLTPAHASTPEEELSSPPTRKSPQRGIAVAILAAGLAINGYTLYSVFYIDSVNTLPSITLLTSQNEIASAQRNLSGTFMTGGKPGDRGIAIKEDGSVHFVEYGHTSNRYESTDVYRIGRRNDALCLATVDNGMIEVLNSTTLRYYGDVYRRAR